MYVLLVFHQIIKKKRINLVMEFNLKCLIICTQIFGMEVQMELLTMMIITMLHICTKQFRCINSMLNFGKSGMSQVLIIVEIVVGESQVIHCVIGGIMIRIHVLINYVHQFNTMFEHFESLGKLSKHLILMLM